MAYLDNINTNSTDYAINAFANLLLASGGVTDAKTVTFPDGYDVTDGSNMTFRVLFPYGHNGQANMTLNGVDVVVNKYGTLIPLPYHNISSTYKSLQANTVLEMYYTSNYDGNNTPAFVIIGNPIVLSSNNYIIYADGKNVADTIYPVGTIYQNASVNTNPNTLFGVGTWEKIEGKFLYGTATGTSLGSTGGASTVTLSESNMPKHKHTVAIGSTSGSFSGDTGDAGAHSGSFTTRSGYDGGVIPAQFLGDGGIFTANNDRGTPTARSSFDSSWQGDGRRSTITLSVGDHKHHIEGSISVDFGTKSTSETGSGTAFSIIPPYVAVNIWKRTA